MFWQEQYQAAVETLVILAITMLPILLGKKFSVRIPHGFETLAVVLCSCRCFLAKSIVITPDTGGGI